MAVAVAAVLLVAGCGGAQKGPGTPAKPGENYKQQTPAQTQTTPQAQPPAKKQYNAAPAMQIDPAKTYTATIKTNMGDIKVELFAKDAPKTVNNFVFLAREKFYDGVIFHRIIKNFMIQTGDPKGDGTGGPGYRFADELPVKRSYDPGIVAMANAGKDTNGSQFFICNGTDCKNLNQMPNYTQFGKVIAGMDVVEKISSVEVVANGREVSKPKTPPVIQTVIIDEK
ncbi:MAG TPA: peptidylprolyl isomerase [Candidatus Sulfotelmatobacter sp.]|nr:peptidylprolyl isomerase [Candidatus Sulfotelmatobacter sp.]